MGVRSLPVIFALLVCLPCAGALPPLKPDWSEGRSRHFRFFTDGPESATTERAAALEALYAVLQRISPDLKARTRGPEPDWPNYVYLFATPGGYKAYSSPGWAGHFTRHADGNYIAMDSSSPGARVTAYHEYLHAFLAGTCPAAPTWLNEGLACFFQTLQLEGQNLTLGRPPEGFAEELFHGTRFPVPRLLAITNASKEYQGGPERPAFYASAWLLTEFLVATTDARRAQLGTYLERLRSGQPQAVCWQQAFGMTPEAMEHELADHLARMKGSRTVATWTLRFRALEVDPAFSFGPLPRSECLARLGLLQAAWPVQALTHQQAALALDGDCPTAHFGLGLDRLSAGRMPEAAAEFDLALKGEPENAIGHYFAGVSLLQVAPGRPEPARLRDARTHLLRAIQLGCPMPDALPMLAGLARTSAAATPGDVAFLEELCRTVPGRQELKAELAEAYLRTGRREPALAMLKEIMTQTADPGAARAADMRLRTLAETEAGTLAERAMEAFRKGRYAEALAAQEEALAIAPEGGTLRPDLQETLRRMRILVDLRTKPRPGKAR